MHCDHTVHFSADLSLCSGNPDSKAFPLISSRPFPVPPGRELREVEYGCTNYR